MSLLNPTDVQGVAGDRRKVLFLRDFRSFTGGHLKVWHYFNHVKRTDGFEALITFTPDSIWDGNNPWLPIRDQALVSPNSVKPDVLFVDGRDWLYVDYAGFDYSRIPVINFIQHVRHADPERKLYGFLGRRAIRICCTDEVAEAIGKTGRVNGPVMVIRYGLEMQDLESLGRGVTKKRDLVIQAIKKPELGRAIYDRIKGRIPDVELLDRLIPRDEFLRKVGEARTALFLPNWTEGFYLPALEAMALGTVVVCPDCTGNRGFCLPGENCYRPKYDFDEIIGDVMKAVEATAQTRVGLVESGRATLQRHQLSEERAQFQRVLRNIDDIWRG